MKTLHRFSVVAQAGEAEIYLYDQIGESFFGGGITAKQFAEELKAIGPKVARIVLRLNSPGGDVFEAAAIFDLLKQSDIPVDVVVDGLAASAAFTVAMAGRRISIGEAGMMMLHDAKAFVAGNASDMRQTADVIEKISQQMAGIYSQRSKRPLAEVRQMMEAETWLTAQEAVDHGFADDVLESPAAEDAAAAMAASVDVSIFQNIPEGFRARVAAFAGRLAPTAKTSSPAKSGETATGSEVKPETVRISAATAAHEGANMANEVNAAAAAEVKEDLGMVERERVLALTSMGKEFSVDVDPFIQEGTTVADAKLAIARIAIERAKRESKPGGLAAPTVQSLSDRERKDYSIRRIIASQLGESKEEAGLEKEVSAAISKGLGMQPRGIFVPMQLNPRASASGQDTKTDAAGKYLVATRTGDLIELLRNKTKVMQMGATVLSGLTSNVSFPRELTATAAAWVAQNPGSDKAESDGTFGVLSLTPKTLQGTTSFSKQLLAQASIDVENYIRGALAISHALAIDLAAIYGQGTNEPVGILGTTGIGDVAGGAAGAVPTYANIIALETAVAVANGDEAQMAFLTTPEIRGKLKQTVAVNTTYGSLPVWMQNGNAPGVGDVIGYPGYVSNQVPKTLVKGASGAVCHAILFGYWPALLIGEFGVMDLVVDPYAKKKQGMIEVTSFQMVDIGVRQPAQFAAMQDAKLS